MSITIRKIMVTIFFFYKEATITLRIENKFNERISHSLYIYRDKTKKTIYKEFTSYTCEYCIYSHMTKIKYWPYEKHK